MKLLNGIDFGVIILYNVILIAVGMYLAKKKIKKASDFTTAGQSLGTFTVAGSIISTCMGASILFSNYQLIHAGGIRAAITSAFWYGAWLILVLLVGRVRKTGASSIPDYISKRFSPRAQKISAWAIVLVGLSTCAAQFKSIGAMAEALNICNPTTGIILGATVIVLSRFSPACGVPLSPTRSSPCSFWRLSFWLSRSLLPVQPGGSPPPWQTLPPKSSASATPR